MLRVLRGYLAGRTSTKKAPRPTGAGSFRPSLTQLEDRVVPSASGLAPAVLQAGPAAPAVAQVFAAAAAQHQAQAAVPLTITGISINNGQLTAHGLLGNQAFSTPVTLTASPNAQAPSCPILDLQLAPIHLNLLGLHVDTSAICLDVTAMPGPGNLLGNLLCDVANALNGGTPLAGVLGGLTGAQTTALTNGLTSLLNGALTDLTTPGLGLPTQQAAVPATDILHLSLGPVDLKLLGLDVHLDNCANGPVTVDVSAQPGPGNLLGNLLSNLSHLLDSSASATALNVHFGQIANEILSLT